MDSMSSGEFRKRYASLTQTTIVTVNGHVIGTWTPGPLIGGDLTGFKIVDRIDPLAIARSERRTFTPVPKPARRR